MKITCQSCQSKYTVSDERVQGKTVKIRCRKCGATILVSSSGATTSTSVTAEPDSLPPGDGGQTFQVNVSEGDQRTMSLAEVIAAYNSATITAETYVWAEGMGDWQPLGQVDVIVAALHNPSAMASSPAMSATAEPAAVTAMPEPAAAEPAPRAAARREAGQRPDLFGSGRSAPMPSAEEIATSAPAFNGSAGGAARATTGQRDENSMLFSLSALTAKAPSSGASGKGSNMDDSGLIDLKAIANSINGPKPVATELALPHDGGLFPLAPPPVAAAAAAAPVAIPTTPPPAPSKAPIFIGVGIAVVALAAVGVFFATKNGGTPVPPVETATQQAAPPPVVTTTEPVPTAAPTPTAEASAAPTASAVAKGGKVIPRSGGGGGVKAGGGTGASTPPPASTPTTPPPPKKDKCGCAPGDLMCAMKCSAK